VNGKVITMTGSSGDTFVTTVAANGATSLVTTDASAAAAHLTITADGTFEVDATAITLDSAAGIVLDASNGTISFKDDGTDVAELGNSSLDFLITNITSDKDIIFRGNDGGASIDALTLDMSDAGTARFNHDIKLADNGILKIGTGGDLELYHNGSHSYISNSTGNLTVLADTLRIQNAGNDEAIIEADANGGVRLFHNNVEKLECTALGVTVTGTAIATTDTDTSNTGNVTLDFAANQNFVLTLTGNTTLVNPTTEQVGQSGMIVLIQDGTGSRTLAVGDQYFGAGGEVPEISTAANAIDVIPYFVQAAGKILLGAAQKAFSDAS
jgi:hypothetical protein